MSHIVQVTFPSSSKLYSYYCPFPVRVGDVAIVEAPSGLTKTRVAAVEKYGNYGKAPWLKTVVSIVDNRAFAEEIKAQEAVRAKAERQLEITKRLADLERELETVARWTALARKSPEAKRLLAELKRISK